MSSITFIPKISKTKLQRLAKSNKQSLSTLINEVLEKYIQEQERSTRDLQVSKIKKLQQKTNLLLVDKKIPDQFKNTDLDDILSLEFEEQLNRFKS